MNHSKHEKLFLAVLSTFIVINMAAFVLMRLRLFSLPATVIVSVVLILLALPVLRRAQAALPDSDIQSSRRDSTLSIKLLYGVLALAYLLYAIFPTYYMLGGRDPGLYLVFSAHIAKTGGLNLDLPILRELYDSYGESIKLGFPGIYSAFERGLSNDPAALIPQFMHLFPAFGAIMYEIAGLEGVVRANAVIATLALWAFYMICRRVMNDWVSLAATTALAINAAFIWNARITLTESLAVLMLFFGLYLLAKAYDYQSRWWATAAGLVLGFAVLNRLDGSLNAIIVFGALLVAFIRPETFKCVAGSLTLAYLVSSTIGFLDGVYHSFPYVSDLWQMGSVKGLVAINYGLPVLGVIVCLLDSKKIIKRLSRQGVVHCGALAVVTGMALWVVFGLLIWPNFDKSFNARSMGELGWYVTVPLIIMTVVGMWLSRKNLDNPLVLPIMALAATVLFGFTYRPSITPDHIWASRRWVPHTIPLIILFSCLGIQKLFAVNRLRLLVTIVSGLLAVYYIYSSARFVSPFISEKILSNLASDYRELTERLKIEHGERYYLTNNTQFASVITYVYQVPTLLLNEKKIDNQKSLNGKKLIGDTNLKTNLVSRIEVGGKYLEKLRSNMPDSLYNREYNADIREIVEHPFQPYDSIKLDEMVYFNSDNPDANDILGEGWYSLEDSFVWSRRHALLELSPSKECLSGSCVVELFYAVFAASDERPVKVSIVIEGGKVDCSYGGLVTDSQLIKVGLPLGSSRIDKHGEVSIKISVPNAVSPASLGFSKDRRVLGVSLHKLRITHASRSGNTGRDHCEIVNI